MTHQTSNEEREMMPLQETRLADAFRRWGYLMADLDDMGRMDPYVHPDLEDAMRISPDDVVERWKSTYAGDIGFEFMHVRDRERVYWLRDAVENGPPPADSDFILRRLLETELFERFLHARYVGSKRFSIDGVAGIIPLLDSILDTAASEGAQFLYLGMSHRGRLNVMRNIVNISREQMFAGMEDVDPRSVLGSGDVKYHLGATGSYTTVSGRKMEIHLSTNPSHLEAVDAVLMGRVRARQERCGKDGVNVMLPVCLHGDAAIAGQGVASEALNFANIPQYTVGGTVHVIVNNLLGFTAEPCELHSSRFASDVALRLPIPIIHVNGERPEAIWWAGYLAARYRYRFKSDVVVDLVGYRRYGHSEVEDPTTTQPLLYEKIKSHPRLYEVYAASLGVADQELSAAHDEVMARFSQGQELGRAQSQRPVFHTLPSFWGHFYGGMYESRSEVRTAVAPDTIGRLARHLTRVPDGFHIHPKVEKLLLHRKEMAAGNRPVDWGMAEALAMASLLDEGVPVRLAGQDSRRGTFNHRHAAWIDISTGTPYVPLAHLADDQPHFEVVDSPLSEAAAMGFEYGYSREYPDGLVCWEAQFGDFANGAQIIIDQFVTAAEDKWKLLSGLVLLLPHGYEGQGPEHSSARVERFLQLAAQDNVQVCQPSSSAQYFYLLRRQALRRWRKPLICFTPKGALRAVPACSSVGELSESSFHTVGLDPDARNPKVILLCAGKISHELRAERAERNAYDRAILTLEQFYPFPEAELAQALDAFPDADRIIWVQEEPANMGGLAFVREKIRPVVGNRKMTAIKRYESASPATGSARAHALEQKMLIRLAFA